MVNKTFLVRALKYGLRCFQPLQVQFRWYGLGNVSFAKGNTGGYFGHKFDYSLPSHWIVLGTLSLRNAPWREGHRSLRRRKMNTKSASITPLSGLLRPKWSRKVWDVYRGRPFKVREVKWWTNPIEQRRHRHRSWLVFRVFASSVVFNNCRGSIGMFSSWCSLSCRTTQYLIDSNLSISIQSKENIRKLKTKREILRGVKWQSNQPDRSPSDLLNQV
jgi:hypothetical protein